MKSYRSILFLLLTVILVSCERAENPLTSGLSGGEGWFMLNFGASEYNKVETKSHQTIVTESQVKNLYIFIFDSNKNKIYGKFFDSNNHMSESSVNSSAEDCWHVSNTTTESGQTTGTVKIKAPAGNGFSIYMLANLDADMVKISSDLLSNNIHTEDDLLNFNVYMNQAIVLRNNTFAMSGKVTGVNIADGSVTSSQFPLSLKRLDSKIKFIFKTGNRTDEAGQTITKFEPKQWKVVNVPRTAYIMESPTDHANVNPAETPSNYSNYAENFFDTGFVNFESFPNKTTGEFAFYMLENRQNPKNASITKYQDRSRQVKTPIGENEVCNVSYSYDGVPVTREMKIFENANDFSTYVLVTGYVEMNLVNDDAGQVLGGEVQYLIHLGDWDATIHPTGPGDTQDSYTDVANFNTERNTSYTYTVTVNSVNNIRVEVDSSKPGNEFSEKQPGATGSVVIAKEEIAICDAHYVAKTLDFHLVNFFEGGHIDAEHCVVDKMTWEVRTPFSNGQPIKEGGIDIVDHLDYKWAHFRLNKKDGSGNYYSEQRRKYTDRLFAHSEIWRTGSENKESAVNADGSTYADGLAGYHNDGIMDITQLVTYMRQQVKLWLSDPASSDFDHQGVDMSVEANKLLPKISMTVFVDEYYYSNHPITGIADQYLWKEFVNKDDREIHILCNSDVSKDAESRATGSVITIKQKSIKTIYNTDPSYMVLQSAWGLESVDEYESQDWVYGSATGRNTDKLNGLLNTAIEWTLANNTSSTGFDTGTKFWNTFLNPEVDNDTPLLNSSYQNLRYSCMVRNRDNNGNGRIDRDEIRWYTGAINQLVGLYMGEPVVNSEAKLYNRTPEEENEESRWYQRVGTSTRYGSSGTNVYTIWSEEGISSGSSGWSKTSDKPRTVRCLRNLGVIDGSSDETYNLTKMPQDYITVEEDASEPGSYIFTCTHLNDNSLRYFSSSELPLADNRSVENRLYKKFKSAPEVVTYGSNVNFITFNNNVNSAISDNQKNPYCPDGYRVPNQRELAIMNFYVPSLIESSYMSRTLWYFGPNGGHPQDISWTEDRAKYGFTIYDGNVSLQNQTLNTTRCVKDIRVN